jgi:hypothetical protein
VPPRLRDARAPRMHEKTADVPKLDGSLRRSLRRHTDFRITPALDKAEGAYDQSPSRSIFSCSTRRRTSPGPTSAGRPARGPIVGYSLAFLNRYVNGDPADPLLTRAATGISLLRHRAQP